MFQEREKEKEKKEKRPLGLGWLKSKSKRSEHAGDDLVLSAPSSPTLSVANHTHAPPASSQPIAISPRASPPTITLDSPLSESVPESPWKLRTSDGIEDHQSPGTSPRVPRSRGHSPTSQAWKGSGEPSFPTSRKPPANLSTLYPTISVF